MYLPVEPGRLIEGPVNRGPENRGCAVYILQKSEKFLMLDVRHPQDHTVAIVVSSVVIIVKLTDKQ